MGQKHRQSYNKNPATTVDDSPETLRTDARWLDKQGRHAEAKTARIEADALERLAEQAKKGK